MERPTIGIFPQYLEDEKFIRISEAYMKAIQKAGGVSLLFPLHASVQELEKLFCFVDGFLFPGGPDIHPKYFGMETTPDYGKIVIERDRLEMEGFHWAWNRRKPIFGICRGIQMMNVALGGTLHCHIPIEESHAIVVGHYQKSRADIETHSVQVIHNTRLRQILQKTSIEVNSFHHQALFHVAEAYQIAGIARDDIVEAISAKAHPFCVGVQWHPEDLYDTNEDARKLFAHFVASC